MIKKASAVVILAMFGCATSSSPRPLAIDDPSILRPPETLGADFSARQTVEATYQGQEIRFEAVLEKKGSRLIVLGLTPFGSRAFLLEQTGTALRFTNYLDRPLPFPPQYILHDIHRILHVEGGAARPDGSQRTVEGDETVDETWRDGRLIERRISKSDGHPPGEVKIDYPSGMAPGEIPKSARLMSGWFGYALTVTTNEIVNP